MGDNAPLRDVALILKGRDGRREIVAAADQAAQRLGITIGMPLTQATAMVKGLIVKKEDPDRDLEALASLAQWMLRRYSPIVAVDFPNGLRIDATGATHLFGGDEQILNDMTIHLKWWNVESRLAMAPTYGAAHALARFSNSSPFIVGTEIKAALGNLPIAALRIPHEIATDLRDLGFERICDFDTVPSASIMLRFGKDVSNRLAQALGQVSEPFTAILPNELIQAKRIFAEPISAPQSLKKCIFVLVEDLCQQLESKQIGARKLDLVFHRVDHTFETIQIGLAQSAYDTPRLARLLSDKLEKVDPGFGIEMARLSAPWVEPIHLRQTSTSFDQPIRPDLASLIDVLGNRIGIGRLYRAAIIESDVPERCIARTVPLAPPSEKDCLLFEWPRPIRILKPYEPIQTIALLPDQPPVSFTWRGKRRKVVHADGPERIFGEWWKTDPEFEAVRDYFQVEDEDGERFWIFRRGDGVNSATGNLQWFLHGFFS